MIDKPSIFSSFSNIIAAQSTRIGGISTGHFNSLNLGLSTEDKEQHISENRKLFFEHLGINENQIASSHQTHGTNVLLANEAQRAHGFDAIITNKENLFVAVTIADCVPVLIYDCHTQAVAAIHAGWRGTAGKIIENTLHEMYKHFGTQGKDCFAFIGTCISKQAFEVGKDVAEQFEKEVVAYSADKEKYYVDLKSANHKQLMSFGIPNTHIETATTCTVVNNNRYFSYRKEKGNTGRMLAVIGRKE